MRDKSVDSADVLDALVAAIIARMLAVGLCEPVPSESLGAARRWCADMRAGLRASNRRARHLPMRYETGLPSSVIRFRT